MGFTLSEDAVRRIVRQVLKGESDFSNKQRRLAETSVRRHETIYMPIADWKLALASSLSPGSWTPVSSGADQFHTFINISPSTGSPFKLDVNGNVEFTETIDTCFTHAQIEATVPFVRNNWCFLDVVMQTQNPDTLAWSNFGSHQVFMTAWPDVAVLSSDGSANVQSMVCIGGIGFTKGWKLRIRATADYSGAAPALAISCPSLTFWYQ